MLYNTVKSYTKMLQNRSLISIPKIKCSKKTLILDRAVIVRRHLHAIVEADLAESW